MVPDERRAATFARWFDERMCTRIAPWRWGTVYRDADFPEIPDSNYLGIDTLPDRASLAGVVTDAERARAEAGLVPRRVVAWGGMADRIVSAFAASGWRADRYVLMVKRRPAEAPPSRPVVAGEVAFAEFLTFREDLAAATEQAGEALRTDRDYAEKVDRRIGTRCFLARSAGRAVAGCVLWVDGSEGGMLDMVATLPAFRGRGAARAAVVAAIEAARAAGVTWYHLYTHAEEGAAPLYRRLGFDDVGAVTEISEP